MWAMDEIFSGGQALPLCMPFNLTFITLPPRHFYRGQPRLRLNYIACKWKRQNLNAGPTFATRGWVPVLMGSHSLGSRHDPWLFLVV